MRLGFAIFQAPLPESTSGTVNQYTGIPAIDQFIQNTVNYAPRILGALLLLILAWIVALIIRAIVGKGLKALKVDERLNTAAEESGNQVVRTLSDVVFWIVFIAFIPGILGVLGLTGILAPVQEMMSNVLGYLPNVLGAALIFVLGMLVANIVKQLVTTFLTRFGLNDFAERINIKADFTEGGLSGLIGTILYALILIAVLSAALSTLKIDAISRPIEGVINPILGAVPNIFGASILIVLSYLLAKVIRNLVRDVLTGLGFNKVPGTIGLSNLPTEGDRSASSFVGHLAFLAIIFYAVIESAKILNFQLLATTVQTIAIVGGQILAGIVILAIGMYVANIVAGLIRDSGVTNSGLLSTVARVAILFFVGAMALDRMGVADEIVKWAFILLLGAISVSVAIAFGIGGIDVAKSLIGEASGRIAQKDDLEEVRE